MTSIKAYKIIIYGTLILWAFFCLFPIYWTLTTSFKTAVSVTQGHHIPLWDYKQKWNGLKSLGLDPV
ncbi:MAG: carbohydrate ABC transporter permease, partial [bacterium]